MARADRRPRALSCGVLVTDGQGVLLGHATRSPRWDIPKGVAEPGEAAVDAAVRELREETGLAVEAHELTDLGVRTYLPAKDLALFLWVPIRMPDPARLFCTARVEADGGVLPEFDRFGVFPWREAVSRVGKNLARILVSLLDEGMSLSEIKARRGGHE